MPDDHRDARGDTIQLLFAWGMPSEVHEDALGNLAWWLSGGIALMLWTYFVLQLTSA